MCFWRGDASVTSSVCTVKPIQLMPDCHIFCPILHILSTTTHFRARHNLPFRAKKELDFCSWGGATPSVGLSVAGMLTELQKKQECPCTSAIAFRILNSL